jgi:16S rRNA (guanine1207-N2)-methyltransferase
MPAGTSIRSSARWRRNEPAPPVIRRDDRLALAHRAGALDLPDAGRIAVFGATETGLYGLLGRDRFFCQQAQRPLHDLLAAQGLAVSPDDPAESEAAIVVASRHRAETLGLIARALACLPEGAPLVVTGARTDGIDAILRQVAAVIPPAGAMSKAHGRVFRLTRPRDLPAEVAEWQEAAALQRNDEGFFTAPGMFSHAHADPGSQRLAAHLDGRLAGAVAELGAGWGWLAARALALNPDIDLLDLHEADARALEAARRNVADPRARFHWSDVTRLGATAQYDWVITNPPFHRTRAAEPTLGAAFVAAASRVLKPAGRLLLVANRSLPYEKPFARAFREVTPLAEDQAYKVIEAARPLRS